MYFRTKTIVKTLTAILMAMIIAVIPPFSVDSNAKGSKSSTDFEEYTVVDIDETTVKIVDIDEDGDWGYTLKVSIENNSDDITYMYSAESASLNGVCVTPYLYTEVKPGKKTNEDLEFYLSEEEEELIGEVTDIFIVMHAYDSNDWSADDIFYEEFHIYPNGEENAEIVEREDEDSDIILAENDDIRLVLTGTEMDEYWGYELKVYLLNDTDQNVVFTIDDASINGYMIDCYWAEWLLPGTQALSDIDFYPEDLEDIDIEDEDDIEQIEFTFRVYDADDYYADDIYSEEITIEID